MRIWCNGCTSPFQGEGVVRFNIPAQCNSVRKSYFASLVQLVGHYFLGNKSHRFESDIKFFLYSF